MRNRTDPVSDPQAGTGITHLRKPSLLDPIEMETLL
jgi:hypothetical protein